MPEIVVPFASPRSSEKRGSAWSPARLGKTGFEVSERIPLSDPARERLGIVAEEIEVLHLNHPLLLLQCLFADGDPALLFPVVAIVRSRGDLMEVGPCSAWAEGGTVRGISEHLANQAMERIRLAAGERARNDTR